MIAPADLYRSANALAHHYSRFRVGERLLLTGHSHQAWPDVGFEGQIEAWQDAAELVDDKWDRAFEKAARVRAGFARLLGDQADRIALGQNTHELVVRFLSGLDLRRRPRLITTDGEFHTIRRQLDRLAEEGIEVVRVPSDPAGAIAERLCRAVTDRTAAVLVSAVLYSNAHIVPAIGRVLSACRMVGAELLVDAYHALNAVPFSLSAQELDGAYVTGGGYKYCQLGEGNCFLRVPPDCTMRPALTGWFAEFDALAEPGTGVRYGTGAARFAGATYDPTCHYRAARVFDFFDREGLAPALLREVSQHQVRVLAEAFDALDVDPATISRDREPPLSAIGGFLAFRAPRARELVKQLRRLGVFADNRGTLLRLGPAPYLSDDQLRAAVAAIAHAVTAARQTMSEEP
jgi:kynureninase